MRYVIAILGLLLVTAGLVGIKGSQIATLMASAKAFERTGPPPEVVSTDLSRAERWGGSISAVGTVAPVRGVSISNDAAGVVSRIHFDSGAFVRAGQPLVELDSRVERAQIAAAQARMELAAIAEKRSRLLVASGAIPQSQLDTDDSGLRAATADVGGLIAQVERKIVRAPFSGRLGIRQVNLGQYLSPGTTLTDLEAIESVYADFTLPQQRLSVIAVGMPIRVSLEGSDHGAWDGAITAIDSAVDSVTRTIRLRATVPNKDEALRPGMFVNVSVMLPSAVSVVTVPATAIVHASYGDSVFLVEDRTDGAGARAVGPEPKPARIARQQFVRIGESRGDFIAILDGVPAGREIVTSGAFKLRNGMAISVNNDVHLDPQITPRPDNR
jgi:membrane fusion protein (multidrug efflux system)